MNQFKTGFMIGLPFFIAGMGFFGYLNSLVDDLKVAPVFSISVLGVCMIIGVVMLRSVFSRTEP